MPRIRTTPSSTSEQLGKWKTPAQMSAYSPRPSLTGVSVPYQLHRSTMAVAVSADGERTLCPVTASSVSLHLGTTNPFANEQKESTVGSQSTAEGVPQSHPSKKPRSHRQRSRKLVEKDHRKSASVIFTQRSSARPQVQLPRRSASSQTDPSLTSQSGLPECVGDPGRGCSCGVLTEAERRSIVTGEEMALPKKNLRESLKILTSFAMMIVLIFWITSTLLDVDVPSGLYRLAANYIHSFNWGQYGKQPQTNAEILLEYVTNFFE